MRRKLLFVILIVSLLLAACAKTEESPTSTPVPATSVEATPTSVAPDTGGEPTTVLFAVTDLEQPLFKDLIESFEEDNPDIRVQLVSINEVLELELLGGDWPDDAWQRLVSRADVINLQAGREAAQQGLIRDLTPIMEADRQFQQDDFYPGALARNQWDGGTWSLPTRVMFALIFYDKDALDEASVPYPEPGWSWDDFLATAKSLTVREGDEVTRWGYVQPWPLHRPFIEGRVGPLIDQSTDPPTPLFDRPEVIETVRWYADLYLKEEVVPFFEPPDEEETQLVLEGQALVESGKAPLWHEWSAVWGFRKEQGNRGVVPFPVDAPDSRTTLLWTQGLSMSAGTAHPEAAWRWMDFLSQKAPTQQGPFVQFLPARRSAAESSGFWDEVDEELAGVLRYAIDHTYTAPTTAGYDAFFEALETILSGEQSVENALAEAVTLAEAEIGEAQAGEAEATPGPAVVVASPEAEEPVSEGVVIITFNPGLGALSNMQAYRDVAQQFHDAHPEIQIELKMPDLTGDSSSINMKGFAESADCFQWAPDIRSPENQAAILGLQPFLEADPSFTIDDFYPPLVEKFTWQGQLWGLPAESQPYIIEYNKDLFDAAGVDLPALDGSTELGQVWTTEDCFKLATALTRGEGDEKQYGFVPQYFEVIDLMLMIERRGAKLIDESVDPPAFTLNDPTTIEALRWYVDLSTEHGVKPIFLADIANVLEANAFLIEREALISEGRAAMWITELLSLFGDRSELNTGVAPLPAGVSNVSGSGSAFGYFISAQTEARQACWQWITFLTELPGLTQGLPARRSVAESDTYRQQVGAERAAVYLASIADSEHASVFDTMTGQGWLSGGIYWLGRAYSQAAAGDASIEGALDDAQKIAENYRACVIAKDAVSNQEDWQACLLEVDPTLPAFLFNQGG
jgi:multiple sugar transport system substrate-binding protein